ncbi:MAG: PQQ-dependent sugar dehydrogenase, partial [Chloroflexota bacterium]
NHNGGSMVFGPDGYLYIGTGDGGGGGDPLGSGRRLDTLLAKVLRIDVNVAADADPPYVIPSDNPYVGRDGARPEIWHTGLRNPWRVQFDQATGDLWIGDVGQGAWEEIDRAPAGVGGLDFGWNTMEGTRCYRDDGCDQAGLTLPVTEYGHDQGCSVTGGTVYRGSVQPALWGWYVFADYCSGRFWVVDPGVEGLQEPVAVLDSGRNISSIAPGPNGELYATDLGGSVHRVVVAGG